MRTTTPSLETVMTAAPVMPVITIHDVADAVPLARALIAGGLHALEITLRTEAAVPAIAAIARAIPDALVGAGTVRGHEQMRAVKDAGGRFCVAPGTTPSLLEASNLLQMSLLPGAATASEVMGLLEVGITHMKFFPAEAAGGAAFLRGIAGPLPEARFCPTGGIKPHTAPDYLVLPNVLCVGGTWVCPPDALAAKDWQRIESLAREAAALKT